ncbi:MAG: orotidine-5'-phosphate decarboxylase [Clostridiales bacterium]|nr:orotidine-5'-phosphate decarboxylase [Clostridiales bacterium]
MSVDLLVKKIKEKGNPSVAGLDPKIDYVPQYIRDKAYAEYGKNLKGACEAIWEFNKGLIDALYDVVPAVKPQSAFYEMYGLCGEEVLHRTVRYAKEKGLYIILDVKRNDIGSTAEAYSKAYLGNVDIDGVTEEPCPVDCVTVNPYLGTDGIKPFVNDCKVFDKAIFALVKTSNPSSGELQDMIAGEKHIYEHVAELVNSWNSDTIGESGYGAVGAVVGATYPEQAAILRGIMKQSYFLVPGYGAQGGGALGVKPCFNDDGLGAIVNSSRGIMCAYKNGDWREEQFAEAARAEAIRMREDITSVL